MGRLGDIARNGSPTPFAYLCAGVFCAVVSQPADNLVSKLNANKSATVGSIVSEMGMVGLMTRGLPLRIVMVRGSLETVKSFVIVLLPRQPAVLPSCPSSIRLYPALQVGTLTGLQWGIYDAFKVFVGLCAPTPPDAVPVEPSASNPHRLLPDFADSMLLAARRPARRSKRASDAGIHLRRRGGGEDAHLLPLRCAGWSRRPPVLLLRSDHLSPSFFESC